MTKILIGLIPILLSCEDSPLWRLPNDPTSGTPTVPPDDPMCADSVHSISLPATSQSIDFMFLLDRSGSMDEPIVEDGGDEVPSRYEAAIEILRQLLPTLDASNRVAIQTFPFSEIEVEGGSPEPIIPPNVLGFCATCGDDPACQPKSCGADADCRSGICRGGICLCESQRICDDGFVCAERFCGDPGSGAITDPAPICNDMNDCNPSAGQVQCRSFNEIYGGANGEPSQTEKCEVERYLDPILSFTNDDASVLGTIDQLASNGLTDSTPMGTALTGTRPFVEAWQRDNPDRRVVQVIMSDGKAEGCDRLEEPEYIRNLLQEMFTGPLRIPTFTLGFFDEDAQEIENLDSYARAAGTNEAFVVELGIDFGQNFASALRAVRDGIVSCETAFPELSPPADPDRLEVDVLIDGRTERLAVAYDQSDCASHPHAWYFDPSPSSGAQPVSLRLCPAICENLRGAASADLQLSLSCAAPTRDFYR